MLSQMESSLVPWEESTEFHMDGDVSINGPSPLNLFIKDDEVVTDQEKESQALHTDESHVFESSLEAKMKEMINLDTTGQDFVIPENICLETETNGTNDEDQMKHFHEEPKMCNERTATYWTGGGGESQFEEELPSLIEDTQLDVDNTIPDLPEGSATSHSNTQIYLPLKKTLRNLRLLDLKLKYNSHQLALDNPGSECNHDSSSSSDENDSTFPESTAEETNNDEDAHNSFLIDLLTQCHHKLEQMEELRLGSSKLAWRVWEAETTIEYLKEKIAELHRENVQKEEEIIFLTNELMKSRRIIQQNMEKAIEERSNIPQPRSLTLNNSQYDFEPICIENDDSEENTKQEQNTSKICVIL